MLARNLMVKDLMPDLTKGNRTEKLIKDRLAKPKSGQTFSPWWNTIYTDNSLTLMDAQELERKQNAAMQNSPFAFVGANWTLGGTATAQFQGLTTTT